MATKNSWVIDAVIQFNIKFPIGTELTADELGRWLITHNGIDDPKTTDPKNPRWMKYVRDRATTRLQLNRYAMSAEYQQTGGLPYEIQHLQGNQYRIMGVVDDIKKITRDYLKKINSVIDTKISKTRRIVDIAKDDAKLWEKEKHLNRLIGNLERAKRNVKLAIEDAGVMIDQFEEDMNEIAALGIVTNSLPEPAEIPPTPQIAAETSIFD